ncbi:MAG: glycosyltransferase family 39 protein, partial [Candidatus Levybacteria bacterium]|nr:glycosyltransferase family 39 protein [Candidatus Levybacteria bacterium]
MNPNFFAYGSFPIYLIYFTGLIQDSLSKTQDVFIQSILISRFYSAILSLLIIPSIYFVGKKLWSERVGLISAILSTFSVGFIQFAHFGTFEMWLTFFGIWFFYFSLKLFKEIKLRTVFIVGSIFGLLMAIKVSSLPLLAIPIIAIKRQIFITILSLIFISSIIFTIFSPYVFLDFKSFLSSMQYESSVAFGSLTVFYTGEFFNSIPVAFQLVRVYPFLLNPFLTLIFIPSFIYVCFIGLKTKNRSYLLLITYYLLLFLPQAFLFAKWTRYMVPTLPFVYLIIAIFFAHFLKPKKYFNSRYIGIFVIIIFSFIFSISYFITAFVKQDTRIQASIWAKENIPGDAKIISEVYDMGIVPFNQYFQNIILFNFYDLDQTSSVGQAELNNLLSISDYIILPSQRVLKSRLNNKNKFSVGNNFYTKLIDQTLGFKKIYETPCDIFCKIIYLGDPVFAFEQTANVFDRPSVF